MTECPSCHNLPVSSMVQSGFPAQEGAEVNYFRFVLTEIKNDQNPKMEHKHSVPRKKNEKREHKVQILSFPQLERSP